jgi:hypothetical protein
MAPPSAAIRPVPLFEVVNGTVVLLTFSCIAVSTMTRSNSANNAVIEDPQSPLQFRPAAAPWIGDHRRISKPCRWSGQRPWFVHETAWLGMSLNGHPCATQPLEETWSRPPLQARPAPARPCATYRLSAPR